MTADRRDRIVLLTIMAAAIALRASLALASPNMIWPDEIFQTLEPAHRLAFGHGVITWEFRDGVRSWLLPGFLAAIMRLSAWLGPGSRGYITGVTVVLSVISSAPIAIAWAWARRLRLCRPWIAAVCTAVWCDLVYFGPKPLTEALAAHVLIVGLYFTRFADEKRSRLVVAGLLLGLVAALRMQLLPAILLPCFWVLRGNKNQIALWLASLVSVVLAVGLLDAATWGYPFHSNWTYLRLELLEHKSAHYGVLPFTQYLGWYGDVWGFGGLAILVLLVRTWRKVPLILATAFVILASHSLIAHKEYRFSYPATTLIIVAASLALTEFAHWLQTHAGRLKTAVAPVILAVWCSLSLLAAARFSPANTDNMDVRVRTSYFRWLGERKTLFMDLSSETSHCGIGLVGIPWYLTGGYTFLHRRLPLILVDDTQKYASLWDGFDIALTPLNGRLPTPFHLQGCVADTCVWMREGACIAHPDSDINRVLKERKQ
jgi:hypothetical protein